MDRELKRLRGEIDRLDERLLALFLERMRLIDEIGAVKGERGLPVRDEAREAEILSRARERAGEACAEEAEEFFRALLAVSRGWQERRRRNT